MLPSKAALKEISILVSSGFGSGFFPKVPGTWGSGAALVFWWVLSSLGLLDSIWRELLLVAVVTAIGTYATKITQEKLTSNPDLIPNIKSPSDPSFIVIDEWAGMLLALVSMSHLSLWGCGLAFVLFRLFDIIKPGPIGWSEGLPGAVGIMADDLLAGLFTLILVQAVVNLFPGFI